MANPGPIISSFWTDDNLGSCLCIDGVICVVDSANILNYLTTEDISYEVEQQISYADRILMNKTDLVGEETYQKALGVVKSVNNFAVYGKSAYGQIDLDFILAINSYAHTQRNIEDIYSATKDHQAILCYPCGPAMPIAATASAAPHMKSVVSSVAFRFEEPFDVKKLQSKLDFLVYEQNIQDTKPTPSAAVERSPMKIYRMKGIIHSSDSSLPLFVLQAVHNLFDLQPSDIVAGSEQDKTEGKSLVIVIGASLDPKYLELQLQLACAASK